ncbi:hypothetical protein NAPIS_ORF02773 [Vairimorpha apis BRL 01]|uniref:Uncharacterized protein n=1 Tax=Vairimorpha apis BRL 01 TaxID=1037528 RepID=T0KVZ2_9MICR|nr:hypothetical protein NAPIS_ORF02773 [Vairimorpha apis BRL 01]
MDFIKNISTRFPILQKLEHDYKIPKEYSVFGTFGLTMSVEMLYGHEYGFRDVYRDALEGVFGSKCVWIVCLCLLSVFLQMNFILINDGVLMVYVMLECDYMLIMIPNSPKTRTRLQNPKRIFILIYNTPSSNINNVNTNRSYHYFTNRSNRTKFIYDNFISKVPQQWFVGSDGVDKAVRKAGEVVNEGVGKIRDKKSD